MKQSTKEDVNRKKRVSLRKLRDDVVDFINILLNFDTWVCKPENKGTEQAEVELQLEESVKTLKQTLKNRHYRVDMNWDVAELISRVDEILAGNRGPSPVLEKESRQEPKKKKGE